MASDALKEGDVVVAKRPTPLTSHIVRGVIVWRELRKSFVVWHVPENGKYVQAHAIQDGKDLHEAGFYFRVAQWSECQEIIDELKDHPFTPHASKDDQMAYELYIAPLLQRSDNSAGAHIERAVKRRLELGEGLQARFEGSELEVSVVGVGMMTVQLDNAKLIDYVEAMHALWGYTGPEGEMIESWKIISFNPDEGRLEVEPITSAAG